MATEKVNPGGGMSRGDSSWQQIDPNLAMFSSKVAAGGDLSAEYMRLFSEDNALQMKADRQGIQIRHRTVRHAMEKRRKLIKKIRDAKSSSGFWSTLSKVFLGVTAAAVGALTCGGATTLLVAAVGLVGGVLNGGCEVGRALYDRQGTRAAADKIQVEHFKQTVADMGQEHLRSLEDAAELEKKMHQRIQSLLTSENQYQIINERRMS